MIRIRRFNSSDPDFDQSLEKLLAFEEIEDESVRTTVAAILADIKKRGDEALLEYTRRFDRLEAMTAAELELPLGRIEEALRRLPVNERKALEQAALRVRAYHEKQLAHSWSYTEPDGTLLGQKITPLDRVGLYVPGGKASYPSSVLMN
ncbi:MAG TPA: histidinol dehydrogenase, partial [Nitrosospira sp.]